MRRSIAALLAIGISVAGLWYASLGVAWPEVWEKLQGANYLYVIPMLLLGAGTFYVRALRWRILLRPLGEFPLEALFSSTAIGIGFCNMVLPGRIGELVKPYLLSRWSGSPLSGLLGSSLMERLFDMLTVLLMLGLVIASLPDAGQLRAWAALPFSIAGILLVTTALLQRRHRLALWAVGLATGVLPGRLRKRALELVDGFIGGLESLGSLGSLVRAGAWSLLLWGMIATVFGMGFLALGMPVPFVWGSMVVLVSVAVAVAAPSAPGFIGTFQAGCLVGLGVYNISPTQALGYSVFSHAVQFTTQVALGAICLIYRGVGIRDLTSAEKVVRKEDRSHVATHS